MRKAARLEKAPTKEADAPIDKAVEDVVDIVARQLALNKMVTGENEASVRLAKNMVGEKLATPDTIRRIFNKFRKLRLAKG
jgi:hypothetical protein